MSDTHTFHWHRPFTERRRSAQFEDRVEAHLPALNRLAGGIIHNPSDVEDLVHDSCVKAQTSDDSNEMGSTAKLGVWLNRILVNTYRDQYRHCQRSPLLPHDYHATSEGSMNLYELVASTEQSQPLHHHTVTHIDTGCFDHGDHGGDTTSSTVWLLHR